jgi:orotate phosphoribosyltransferase
VFIGGTERIVIFVDEPADAQDLIKCVSRSASKFPVHVTIVEVIYQDLPTNTDRHCEIAVSPYFADQELADMCKLLTKIYPESAAALDDLMHYVASRAATDHKAADRHLYVALLTASRGSFAPICDYVKKLHEQSLLQDYPVLSLLSLLSAYAPRMGRLRESVSKCLIAGGPSSAVRALCRRDRGFVMFQHAFLALVYIRIVTLRTIIAHASDAVDTINNAGTHACDAVDAIKQAGTHASDAVDAINNAGTHVSDAVDAINQAGTHASDAVDAINSAGTHVSDAVDAINQAGNHASDAVDAINNAGTHVSDAVAAINQAGTHASDAVDANNNAGTHVSDAVDAINQAGTHASDAVDAINNAGTHEYDDKHATHLLSLRMKGNDFSLMINDCLLQSMSMNETFAVFDGPLGQKLDVTFANIVKSRLIRKHFGSDAEDSEIIFLATRARDRLAGTKHSRLALSNLVEVYRYLVESGKKQYEVDLKHCTQAYEEAGGSKSVIENARSVLSLDKVATVGFEYKALEEESDV